MAQPATAVKNCGDVATSTAIRRGLVSVEPGSSETLTTTLFVGPKLQEQLEEINEKLKLTVDYGWLVFIAKPMYWVLERIQGDAFDGYQRTIDVHIRNLRAKIEPDPANPVYLITQRGRGYKLLSKPLE